MLPSGRPPEDTVTLVQDDPTWELEYAHFKALCAGGDVTDLSNDIKLNRMLRELGVDAVAEARPMSKPTIGFAGLTHLGLVSAVGVAAKGFPWSASTRTLARVEDIAAGRLPVVEPGLDELFHEVRRHADIHQRCRPSSRRCDVVYISTDVPTDDRGQSDLAGIRASIAQVIESLGPNAILVVLCQVPPGFTRQLPLPPDRLYYQVETLVFGRAVERATQPERYIVGCADPAKPLPAALASVLAAFGCPILPMRYESAELAKIAINCCLVASVTVANTLGGAVGADRRRLERDRAGAQARRADRAGRLSAPRARHRRRQPGARSRRPSSGCRRRSARTPA